ncbi:hypothetical protein [uncultured Ligilactobacillus sp.]|uniref:hypothetical protein n=1 Tax=uncultured Ligilactobacillus sp. TaxID=2837633 RepID=UPI00272976E4|nr:hypothetical protein [uncultured Ligilactobacillus sp.]
MTLEDIAFEMRKRILKLAWTGRSGHIGTSLSATDILVELYFDQILRYDSGNPDWESRDRFILSKGGGKGSGEKGGDSGKEGGGSAEESR